MNKSIYEIKFRPMEVDNYIATALQLLGKIDYTYLDNGSIVKLTPHQLDRFIDTLTFFIKGLKEEDANDPEILNIQHTLKYIEKYIMGNQNIAQASDKSKSKVPKIWFQNYDYTNDIEGDETSPGGGLFHGPMSKFKSVEEFLDKKRQKKTKEAYLETLDKLGK